MKKLLFILTSLIYSNTAFSDEPKNRLMPYEPSYGVYQKAAGDESAIRLHYSFRYCITSLKQDVSTQSCRSDFDIGSLYFSYTGEFDFYMNTRPSSPVINRLNNPALHFRRDIDLSAVDWVDIAYEHRSNGQVLEVSNPITTTNAQAAYASNNHAYFDGISRGANYLSIEAKKDFEKERGSSKGLSLYGKIKYYSSKDSDVTWGSLAGAGVSISDYDRVKLLASKNFGKDEASLEWTIGDKGLGTDSWNVDYLFNRDAGIPLYLKYHNGPMHTLSNYTQNQHYFSIGVKFTP